MGTAQKVSSQSNYSQTVFKEALVVILDLNASMTASRLELGRKAAFLLIQQKVSEI
jgi:hypothetical protein